MSWTAESASSSRDALWSVAVFCGGRGSATLVRQLLRCPGVELSLLVNAYDDGLSTGALRSFVPGLLGPSDFRKNLARLLELSSPGQVAVARLLECRFGAGANESDFAALVDAFHSIAAGRRSHAKLPEPFDRCGNDLEPSTAALFARLLERFHSYNRTRDRAFEFGDCALGNLLLAGAFLGNGGSFNGAVAEVGAALRCRARIINVTRGENRVLVALKEDGEILASEACIVGPQSRVPIRRIYLLAERLTPEAMARLQPLSPDDKDRALSRMHRSVDLSPEAAHALLEADLVVFGAGTLHSSLLPSYLTRGLPEALAANRRARRVVVVNLREDHDTQGLAGPDLVDLTLRYLQDPDNRRRTVTDLVVHQDQGSVNPFGGERWRGARVHRGDYASPANAAVHNGSKLADTLLGIAREGHPEDNALLDVYVDLHQRSLTVDSLLQEFADSDWSGIDGVTLRINRVDVSPRRWPDGLGVERAGYGGIFSDVAATLAWLERGRSRFLACMTGDGEYRFADVRRAIELLRSRRFGAILGARNQSRRQFFGSLRHAYQGRRLMHAASVAGGFGVAAVCAARFGIVLADPLTGFRVFDRLAFSMSLRARLRACPPATPLELLARLLADRVEVAEIPVSYVFYAGFTDERWRLLRGLAHAVSVLR